MNEYKEDRIVYCACDMHLMRLQFFKDRNPYLYVSLFEESYYQDSRLSFWQRLRNAWLEFKGELKHDSILIEDKETLEGLYETLGGFLADWDECEKKTWPSLIDFYDIMNSLDAIYEEEYS